MSQGSLLKKLRMMLVVATVVALTGCASTSGYQDPRDPIEGFNRAMFQFNESLDRAVVKPVAKGYRAIMPAPVDTGITNFFSNLADIGSAIKQPAPVQAEEVGIRRGQGCGEQYSRNTGSHRRGQ